MQHESNQDWGGCDQQASAWSLQTENLVLNLGWVSGRLESHFCSNGLTHISARLTYIEAIHSRRCRREDAVDRLKPSKKHACFCEKETSYVATLQRKVKYVPVSVYLNARYGASCYIDHCFYQQHRW